MFYLTFPEQILYGWSNSTKGEEVWRSLEERFSNVRLAARLSKFRQSEQRLQNTAHQGVQEKAEGRKENFRKLLLSVWRAVRRFLSTAVMRVEECTALMSAETAVQSIARSVLPEYLWKRMATGLAVRRCTGTDMCMNDAQIIRTANIFMFYSIVSSLRGILGRSSQTLSVLLNSAINCTSILVWQYIISMEIRQITGLRICKQ